MIGIYGGTFDPIHLGHEKTALAIYATGLFTQIRLMPCKVPVHKAQAKASAAQRARMINCVIAEHEFLHLDQRELHRETPSYMVDSLLSLRRDYPHQPLALILGMDALQHLDTWYRWPQLLDLAHLWVLSRPGYHLNLSEQLAAKIMPAITGDTNRLVTQAHGQVYLFAHQPYAISSTQIRQQAKRGIFDETHLNPKVIELMQSQQVY